MGALLTRASYTIPMERLERFALVLNTGLSNGPGESVAILLRDWLLRNGAGSSALQTELYWKAERALRAFLDEEELTMLYASSIELFPLPGEPVVKSLSAKKTRARRDAQRKRA